MTDCAYCERDEDITREHVWPRCIIERVPTYTVRYAARAKKIITSDLTVKDVCKDCNNGPLSELDSYFCSLYDQYFKREIHDNQPLLFKYDWGKLSRALLKISYNSSRTTGIDAKRLKSYAKTITAPDAVPIGVFIKVATIHASHVFDTPEKSRIVPAKGTRCGPIEISNRSRDGLAARLIQIDSFRFYIAVTDDFKDRPTAVRYLVNQNGTWLSPAGETLIPFPTLDTLSSMEGVQNWRRASANV